MAQRGMVATCTQSRLPITARLRLTEVVGVRQRCWRSGENRMRFILKYVIWAYVLAAGAYRAHRWYFYTGLYRVAAEWQLEHFGSYSGKLTIIVPLLILLIPGAVLAQLFGVQDQLRSVGSGAGSPRHVRLAGCGGLGCRCWRQLVCLLEIDRKGRHREHRSLEGRHAAIRARGDHRYRPD